MSEGAGMRVETDTVVTIEYRACLTNGELVDSTDHCGPVTYLHGNEQIFPALEQAVDGLLAGEERRLSLAPNESYGEHRPERQAAGCLRWSVQTRTWYDICPQRESVSVRY